MFLRGAPFGLAHQNGGSQMFDVQSIRYHILIARQIVTQLRAPSPAAVADAEKRRDDRLATLLAESMIHLRRERSAATRDNLKALGFTADELTRLEERAKDAAALAWERHSFVEAAA